MVAICVFTCFIVWVSPKGMHTLTTSHTRTQAPQQRIRITTWMKPHPTPPLKYNKNEILPQWNTNYELKPNTWTLHSCRYNVQINSPFLNRNWSMQKPLQGTPVECECKAGMLHFPSDLAFLWWPHLYHRGWPLLQPQFWMNDLHMTSCLTRVTNRSFVNSHPSANVKRKPCLFPLMARNTSIASMGHSSL